MMSRHPGVSVQAANGSSHSSHRQSPQASPALQSACPGSAAMSEPAVAPALPPAAPLPPAEAPADGSVLPPPLAPPLDGAGCPLGAVPLEPALFGGAIGATGRDSRLTSEPEVELPLGAVPPSGTVATPSEPATPAPAGAAGLDTSLTQPGSSQVSEASWIPSSELHADAAISAATHRPGRAATARQREFGCGLCLRIIMTRRPFRVVERELRAIVPQRSGGLQVALHKPFQPRSSRQKASSEHGASAQTADQLSLALPSVA